MVGVSSTATEPMESKSKETSIAHPPNAGHVMGLDR